MKRCTINENGDAVDPETGKVIGRRGADGMIHMLQETPPEPTAAPSPEAKPSPNPTEKPRESAEKSTKSSSVVKPQVSYSRYEVSRESTFTVRFCLTFKEGRPIVLQEDANLKVEGAEAHWATFRMWSYREELEWKSQTMEYDLKSRAFRQNTTKLDELKIRNLMRSWSFEEYDPKFRLLHANGILSDESYDLFMGMYPAIVGSIIFLMNSVLESNG